MSWKKALRALEQHKEWDFAIKLMEEVIDHNPQDMDAYLFMNYLLMNLLVEEDYDDNKHDYYASLLLHYFEESYQKFSSDPKYLFYSGRTAIMSEWYFGIEQDDVHRMMDDALLLAPENMLFQSIYYLRLCGNCRRNSGSDNSEALKEIKAYIEVFLKSDSSVQRQLAIMGAMGAYLWEITENWGNDFLKNGLRY